MIALPLPALRRALALVLLTAAACAIPAQFGDLGPGGRVIADDSCPRPPPAPTPAPAPQQASAAAPDRKALDATCAAPLVQKQALTSVGGYPLEEAPVGGWIPSLPPAPLLGRSHARHQLQPLALEPEPMTLTHTEYGDGTLAIVSRRLAEGHCVVGTWHLSFGGNGVESWVRQVVVGVDKRAALILIETIGHFRAVPGAQPPIPAAEQRFWTVLSATSDGLRALSDDDARLGGEPRVILVSPPMAKAEDTRLEVGKGRRVWRIDRKSGKFEPSQ